MPPWARIHERVLRIARVSAATIVSAVGELSRFQQARQLMGYSGVVAREDSTGERIRRGGITKTGNAHLRRIVIEAAWLSVGGVCAAAGVERVSCADGE
jgi:transposase